MRAKRARRNGISTVVSGVAGAIKTATPPQYKTYTVAVESNVYPEAHAFVAPQRYTVTGAYNLSGDGAVELLIHSEYYEGAYTTVYEADADEPYAIGDSGCGV